MVGLQTIFKKGVKPKMSHTVKRCSIDALVKASWRVLDISVYTD